VYPRANGFVGYPFRYPLNALLFRLDDKFPDKLYGEKMWTRNSNVIAAGTLRLFQETGEYMVMLGVLQLMQQRRPLFVSAAISHFMVAGCCVSRMRFIDLFT
jgi:hypothetical protein